MTALTTAAMLLAVVSITAVDSRPQRSVAVVTSKASKRSVYFSSSSSFGSGGGRSTATTDSANLSRQLAARDNPSAKMNVSSSMANDGAAKVRISDYMSPGGESSPRRGLSVVTQSVLTFVTVFVFGCAVVLATFAWKRFSSANYSPLFRRPTSYEYSALSQFDGDPDDEDIDEEDIHKILAEDSSSEDDDEDEEDDEFGGGSNGIGILSVSARKLRESVIDEETADDGDDDVFATGAVDPDAPATLPVSETTEARVSVGSGGSGGSRRVSTADNPPPLTDPRLSRPSATSLIDDSELIGGSPSARMN